MAKKDDLNLGNGKQAAPAGGGKGKLLIIVLAAVAVAAVAAAVYFFLQSNSGSSADAVQSEPAAEAEAPREPRYLELEKLLVNLKHQGRTHYVQAEMQIMAFDPAVIEQAQRDMPAIRNRLIMLFSAQDYAELETLEGKEALRAATRDAVNEVLGRTPPDAVEEVYFEAFVLQ